MESKVSVEIRNNIDEQLETIKAYVDGFELFVPKDETALGEIGELVKAVVARVKELDEARLKRKHLLGELNRAYSELEESHKKFVENIKAGTH
jgi:ATP-dependent helicase/DNAse subunit B